jgi:hypothetical protein
MLATVSLAWTIHYRYWTPHRKQKLDCFAKVATKVAKPMQVALCLHFALYILELGCTGMVLKYTSMAIHHLFSLLLFLATLREPASLCFWWIVPYWLHAVYWVVNPIVSDAAAFALLVVYNVLLFMGGIALYYSAVAHQANSTIIPVMAFAIAAVNYYTYCSPAIQGAMCLYRYDALLWFMEGRTQVWEMFMAASAVAVPFVSLTCVLIHALAAASKGKTVHPCVHRTPANSLQGKSQ